MSYIFCQVLLHSTYPGGHTETYHRMICSMPEIFETQFSFPNFTAPGPGTLRELLDNQTTTRDNIFLDGLGMTKDESGSLSMILKIGM